MIPALGEVLIVGTGLIGASVGKALTEAGASVWLSDADPQAEIIAAGRGAGRLWSESTGVEPALVVVAVPPRGLDATIRDALERYPAATVTDVGSVKASVYASLRRSGVELSRFVGGHPIAGREISGASAARSDLFEDRIWVICPGAESSDAAIAAVQALVRTCGGVEVMLDPESHDRAVAVTSHTPQLVSSALAARLTSVLPAHAAISGQGLADMTRIAASDPELWGQIVPANADAVADVLDEVIADLRRVADELRGQDAGPAVKDLVARGRAGRVHVPGKHGTATPVQYATVTVAVADRPGEWGRLFASAGRAGVNLEDLRIEHTLGRLSALVDLDVAPDDAPILRKALGQDGWEVRG